MLHDAAFAKPGARCLGDLGKEFGRETATDTSKKVDHRLSEGTLRRSQHFWLHCCRSKDGGSKSEFFRKPNLERDIWHLGLGALTSC